MPTAADFSNMSLANKLNYIKDRIGFFLPLTSDADVGEIVQEIDDMTPQEIQSANPDDWIGKIGALTNFLQEEFQDEDIDQFIQNMMEQEEEEEAVTTAETETDNSLNGGKKRQGKKKIKSRKSRKSNKSRKSRKSRNGIKKNKRKTRKLRK